ncbi:Haloacid dehalogenase-like hydrolase domain-containing protein 3 [Termitomyces sp. T112]|nr:Haloacid dehalogenase-like hydrolase domain-containing protein 3 [Termitomyces sp. T112]
MAALRQPIRLVTFDALYTTIVPRLPIHVQYSHVFRPYLGVLDLGSLKQSFRVAFQSLERENLAYDKGSRTWWSEVIKRTALGAGADEKAIDAFLPQIVSRLLDRFSSKEGYRAFDDAITVVNSLHKLNIQTALISNADSRIRSVLRDLEFPVFLDPIILSEEEGVEKPSPEIYRRALAVVNSRNPQNPVVPAQCLHVGDELDADYHGAQAAGMNALLLQRSGADGEQAHRISRELKGDVTVIKDLRAVLPWVTAHNSTSSTF